MDLEADKPYNPLDKTNLGVSISEAVLASEVHPLPPVRKFEGAGIYCIYYRGKFPLYDKVSAENCDLWKVPIYVGKAVPSGARKGHAVLNPNPGDALFKRLAKHAKSISDASNLSLEDFRCRYLVVEDIWIPLGEATLVQHLRPLWNVVVDGFGNNDPGGGRYGQERSQWDTLHPGRDWAKKCRARTEDPSILASRVLKFEIQGPDKGRNA